MVLALFLEEKYCSFGRKTNGNPKFRIQSSKKFLVVSNKRTKNREQMKFKVQNSKFKEQSTNSITLNSLVP